MVWYLLFQYCAPHEHAHCVPVAMPGGIYLAEWQCQLNARSFPKQVQGTHFCWVGPSPAAGQGRMHAFGRTR